MCGKSNEISTTNVFIVQSDIITVNAPTVVPTPGHIAVPIAADFVATADAAACFAG